jgi:hypothetical protein
VVADGEGRVGRLDVRGVDFGRVEQKRVSGADTAPLKVCWRGQRGGVLHECGEGGEVDKRCCDVMR